MRCGTAVRVECGANNTPGSLDGAYTGFVYSANTTAGTMNTRNDYAVVNPTTSDGTNTALQPGVSPGIQLWYTQSFAYPNNAPTTMTDTQGHSTVWHSNGPGNIWETSVWTAVNGSFRMQLGMGVTI